MVGIWTEHFWKLYSWRFSEPKTTNPGWFSETIISPRIFGVSRLGRIVLKSVEMIWTTRGQIRALQIESHFTLRDHSNYVTLFTGVRAWVTQGVEGRVTLGWGRGRSWIAKPNFLTICVVSSGNRTEKRKENQKDAAPQALIFSPAALKTEENIDFL